MTTNFDGYKEARPFDEQINALLEKKGINKDNALAWLSFTRTISSGLEIIRKEALKQWKS